MASRSVISLQHLNVTVGSPPRTLVAALSLRIHANERWAVVGANGAGKTVTSSLFARRVIGGADASAAAALAVHVSFDSHRRLLRDEQRAFRESRYEQNVHKRATPASFLFPHLVPEDPEGGTRAARTRSGYKGYRPPRSRLSPLPVRHDAQGDEPLLAALEGATCGGAAGSLLRSFSLLEARHRPLHVLSTSQLRKALLASCLLAPPKLLLLDEALDGLDARSRRAALEAVQTVTTQHDCALVMVAHRTVDLPPSPTHALLLGLGDDGTGWQAGTWDALRSDVQRFLDASDAPLPPLPLPPPPPLPPPLREASASHSLYSSVVAQHSLPHPAVGQLGRHAHSILRAQPNWSCPSKAVVPRLPFFQPPSAENLGHNGFSRLQ